MWVMSKVKIKRDHGSRTFWKEGTQGADVKQKLEAREAAVSLGNGKTGKTS